MKALRWVFLIPASIGSCILYAINAHPVLFQGLDDDMRHALRPLISIVIAIVLAYNVAPSYKFRISLIAAGLLLLLPIAGAIIVIFGIKINGEEQTIIDGGVAIVTTLIGIIVGLFITWQQSIWTKK